MKRLVVLALIAQLAGCNFAVKHPAATAAIAGGTIGFGTCAMESSETGTCALIGGGTAAFMGLVAGIAIWAMGGDDDSHLMVDPAMDNPEDGPIDIPAAQRGDMDPAKQPAAAPPPPVPVVEPAPPPSLPPPPTE